MGAIPDCQVFVRYSEVYKTFGLGGDPGKSRNRYYGK